ncbi:MAG: AsmA-like C-terminal region-containing protein [Beijerinckiaceae bacterium]
MAGLFAAVALIGGIGFGALMFRLAKGPIEFDQIGERAAEALTKRFDGAVQFTFGATRIARTEHGPTITVDGMKAVAAGRTVVESPRAELSLDPLALLRLDVSPRRLHIYDLTVRLLVLPDGALAMTAGGPHEEAITLSPPPSSFPTRLPPAPGDKPRRSIVLKEAAAALRAFFDLATSPKSPLAALQSVAVHNGKLVVDDKTADRTTAFGDVEMAFDKTRRQTTFSLAADGPNGKISIHAKALGTPDSERQLDIEARDISMDEIILVAGTRRPVIDSDASLSFKMRFILEATNELREASGRAVFSPGYLRLEDPDHEPLFFDEISGGFHWDTVNQRIVVDPVQFFAGETQFVTGGALDPPTRPQDGWKMTLGLIKPGGIAADRPGEKFLAIEKADVEARIFIDEKHIAISRAEIAGPQIAVAAAGDIDWVTGAHIRLGVSAGRMPIRSLFRVWPSLMGAPARNWLIQRAHGGMIETGTAAVDFDKDALLSMRHDRPPPDESVALDFRLSGGSLTALDGIPDVTGLDGSGHVTGRTAAFNATAGSMETAPGRKLAMASGSFGLPWNDGLPATPAFVEAKLGGSVEAVADLLSRDAIKDFASLPLEPGSLKGQVDGRLRVDFKVGPAATGQDVKIGVNANVSNFTADHLLGKERFEAGTLTVVGDPGGIKANGSGRMFGLPASLDLRKDVGQPTIVNLSASVDEAARARFGMGSPAITGPAGLKLTAVFDRDTKVGVDLDLTRVGLNNPVPGVTKAAGRPGRATFNLVQRDNAIRIDDLVADLGGPSARGSIELSGQGEFIAARLSQAKVSPGDDMRIEIVKMGEAYRTTVRGASLDARPFIKSVTQGGDGRKENDDFELDLKMPVLSGFQRQSIVNADMRVSRKNGALRALSMSGQFGRGPFSAVLARGDNGQPQVNVSSADAGALLGFTDLYARMEGGSLTAAMQFGDRTVTGMLNVKTFFLRDEPSLRRLVTEGSVRVDSNGARVDPTLVRFDRLSAVFSRTGGLLTVRDGVMNGPNIGLTFEGQIDSDRDALALNGTFIPAYTVNNFFAKIPVVGLLLGGGWNEGLFAINYRIAGRMSAPQVSVNPLTVAPGFLRKIFGAFDNATSAPPTR